MSKPITVAFIVSQLVYAGLALADVQQLSEVLVTGERVVSPTRQMDETVYTGSEISRKGIELQGPKADASVYEAINLLPGLNYEGADGRGLSVEQGGLRTRGIKGMLGALTVAGVPNYGGNPIGPRDYLYDLENMESIAIYKGAVPADIGTGVGSRGGAIELRPDWPHQKFGARLSQGFGSDNYYRTFLRLDSGRLSVTETSLSGSYSYSQADKWRGSGELGPRHNFNLALSQPVTNRADIKLWYNYNSIKQDMYRPLTFDETRNLKLNYRKDYNAGLSGDPSTDFNYYKYNRGSFINRDFLSIITINPTDLLRFSIKPYYSVEDTRVWQGVANNGGMVQKRTRDIERTGLITEANYGYQSMNATVGYHFEAGSMDVYIQNYGITSSGLSYRGYGVFGSSGTSYINSPYIKVAGSVGNFNWQAGLKYFNYAESASKGYTSPAPSYNLVRAADLDRKARDYDILLPTAGISYSINENLQLQASYGRNFIRPYSYIPLVNLYNSNRAAFQAKGISLNDLFDGYRLEESDNFDFGARYSNDFVEIAPTFFFGLHKNLLTTVYDPRVNLSYQQNIGKATGYGLDLELNAFVTDYITFFLNPTWTQLSYDQDMVFQGNRLSSKGKQVVDTPEWMLKGGIILKLGDFEITPKFRVIGERYGDVEHREKIDPYAVADLSISYTKKQLWGFEKIKLALDLSNITDERYVSVVDSFDDTRAGGTSYFQGEPFSAIGSVTLQF